MKTGEKGRSIPPSPSFPSLCLFSTYYVPDTMLEGGDTVVTVLSSMTH